MKNTAPIHFLLLAALFINLRCKKGEVIITKPPGTFTATIDGANWEPEQYEAIYFSRLGKLHISALGNNRQFLGGVQLDNLSPLKNYVLESQGNHAAEVYRDGEPYHSDENVAGAGGNFQLVKLDTVQKKVSAVINFTAFGYDRVKKLVFATKTIEDISLKIDTTSYDGSFASCTVAGVNTVNWQTKDVWGAITCISNGVDRTMKVELPSAIGGFANRRYLQFFVPLNLRAGTYPLQPDYAPYFYCGRLDVTCRYSLNNYNNAYYATAGSFTINSIDTARRTLTASFQVTVRDTSARRETIQITNGQLRLNSWFYR